MSDYTFIDTAGLLNKLHEHDYKFIDILCIDGKYDYYVDFSIIHNRKHIKDKTYKTHISNKSIIDVLNKNLGSFYIKALPTYKSNKSINCVSLTRYIDNKPVDTWYININSINLMLKHLYTKYEIDFTYTKLGTKIICDQLSDREYTIISTPIHSDPNTILINPKMLKLYEFKYKI